MRTKKLDERGEMDDYEVERQGIFAAARQEAIEFKREFVPEFRFPTPNVTR